jgi:NAD(P)-dependent dehydrogenase (short-subunit alcohol dehydrogenase family)
VAASRDVAQAWVAVRVTENLKRGADAQLAAAELAVTSEGSAEAKEQAEDAAKANIRDIDALRMGIAALTDSLGTADVLINNAGNDERHGTFDVTPEIFDERIAVNLRPAFFAAQAVLPGMQAKVGGVILNFSSVSWMGGMGGMPIYAASKSAMIRLMRSLACDYGQNNIRVNAIAPGWVKTERQLAKWVTCRGRSSVARNRCPVGQGLRSRRTIVRSARRRAGASLRPSPQ